MGLTRGSLDGLLLSQELLERGVALLDPALLAHPSLSLAQPLLRRERPDGARAAAEAG